MEIQAKLSFKHGRLMRILNENDMNIKDMSLLCGWDYKALCNFISFKRIPENESRENLVMALQQLDPEIKESDIFPEQYDKLKEAFKTKVITKDIPLDKILSYDMDTIAIADETMEAIDSKIDISKAINFIKNKIDKRGQTVLFLYFGIGYKKPKTFLEIAKILGLSKERVRQIMYNKFRKIYEDCEFRNNYKILVT